MLTAIARNTRRAFLSVIPAAFVPARLAPAATPAEERELDQAIAELIARVADCYPTTLAGKLAVAEGLVASLLSEADLGREVGRLDRLQHRFWERRMFEQRKAGW